MSIGESLPEVSDQPIAHDFLSWKKLKKKDFYSDRADIIVFPQSFIEIPLLEVLAFIQYIISIDGDVCNIY